MTAPDLNNRTPPTDVRLKVKGLHCTNCARSLEKHLRKVGAESPSVDFATGETHFQLPVSLDPKRVIESVERLGYTVANDDSEQLTATSITLRTKVILSSVSTCLLMAGMILPGLHFLHYPLLQLLICIPPFAIGVHHFGASAIRSLRAHLPNMDVLIVFGVIAGFSCSVLAMFAELGSEFIYFEAVSSIVTFVLLGQLMEQKVVSKTTSAIEELLRLKASTAVRVTGQKGLETVTTIDASQISVGDHLQVNSGDKIPTDGVVIAGSAFIDESMVSGEPFPVERTVGSNVVGSTVVSSGQFTMRATAIGEDTLLASIVLMVKDAHRNKPSLQRIGDKVGAVFVPIVIAFSAIFFLLATLLFELSFSQAMVRALAIVVIACPCAMGLATPTAVMVALGRAARRGILIKGGDTFERIAAVKQFVFDKTGTITEGKIGVDEIEPCDTSIVPSDYFPIISTLEAKSSHPLARALLTYTKSSDSPSLSVSDIREVPGLGMFGTLPDGSEVALGGHAMAKHLGIPNVTDLSLFLNKVQILRFKLTDTIREDAASALADLRSVGGDLALLSGDSISRCREVSDSVGIKTYFGEKLPDEKRAVIAELQQSGPIAYVGDGINDAPTLSQADVGISLSSASEVAVQSAQVILVGGKLAKIPELVLLSRLTVRTIKQNLAWAFAYNLIALPLAATGFISPTWGALIMSLSDVIIVGNSLLIRTRRLRLPHTS